ncbi:MAG: Rid family hydrolase [Burkholderiaceae bacterium]
MSLRRIAVSGASAPLSRAVEVPAANAWVVFSAQMPPVVDPAASQPSVATFGNTETQTFGCLQRVEQVLREADLGLEDLVSVRAYLVADPATGEMDFDGFSRGWTRFFESRPVSGFPARSVVQVAGLVKPGWLVELEPLAARKKD